MKQTVEKILFRYETDTISQFSKETLYLMPYYMDDYVKALSRNADRFIQFLYDCPDGLFFYLYHTLHKPGFEFLLEHKKIKKRISFASEPKNKELLTDLYSYLANQKGISYTQRLYPNQLFYGFYIGLQKTNFKYDSSEDFFITIEDGEIHLYELMNDFRKNNPKDLLFLSNKNRLKTYIREFKENNRLVFCFA